VLSGLQTARGSRRATATPGPVRALGGVGGHFGAPHSVMRDSTARRLVVTVCPREPGAVRLPVTRGDRVRRLDASAILQALTTLVQSRGLDAQVRVREGCAGGCSRRGPNVNVDILAAVPDGRPHDSVAVGWKTYVYSLGTLACLADVIDENLGPADTPADP